MDLKGIISISGKPGLSKIISQTRTGLIIESLLDGKRSPVHGAERVSSLEDISIYTYEEDIPLTEVFEKMFKASDGKEVLSHKSSANELSSYLKGILPDYDADRVYASDIKKLVQWYNLLQSKGLLGLESDSKEDNSTKEKKKVTTTKKPIAKTKTKAPKKVAAPAKKAAPKGAAKGR